MRVGDVRKFTRLSLTQISRRSTDQAPPTYVHTYAPCDYYSTPAEVFLQRTVICVACTCIFMLDGNAIVVVGNTRDSSSPQIKCSSSNPSRTLHSRSHKHTFVWGQLHSLHTFVLSSPSSIMLNIVSLYIVHYGLHARLRELRPRTIFIHVKRECATQYVYCVHWF